MNSTMQSTLHMTGKTADSLKITVFVTRQNVYGQSGHRDRVTHTHTHTHTLARRVKIITAAAMCGKVYMSHDFVL
jgi:predicted amidohydrolase YtcJ